MDVAGVVVTADTLHTQREHARHLVADYVLTVKEGPRGGRVGPGREHGRLRRRAGEAAQSEDAVTDAHPLHALTHPVNDGLTPGNRGQVDGEHLAPGTGTQLPVDGIDAGRCDTDTDLARARARDGAPAPARPRGSPHRRTSRTRRRPRRHAIRVYGDSLR